MQAIRFTGIISKLFLKNVKSAPVEMDLVGWLMAAAASILNLSINIKTQKLDIEM